MIKEASDSLFPNFKNKPEIAYSIKEVGSRLSTEDLWIPLWRGVGQIKMKGWVVDFRSRTLLKKIPIQGKEVQVVDDYMYLGVPP